MALILGSLATSLARPLRRARFMGPGIVLLVFIFIILSFSLPGRPPPSPHRLFGPFGDGPPPPPPEHHFQPNPPPSRVRPAEKKPRIVKGAHALANPVLPKAAPGADDLVSPFNEDVFGDFFGPPDSKPPNTTHFPTNLLYRIRPVNIANADDDVDGREATWASKPLEPASGTWAPPKDSYAGRWKDPSSKTFFKGRKKMAKIQWSGFETRKDDDETTEIEVARCQIIRNAFLHAWEGYKATSWGHDEVKPVTGEPSNPFMQWGATIIDSLDTLLIMGLQHEFQYARKHVRDVDFGIISGIDWGRVSDQSGRRTVSIHAFETVIRYMGGLLGAYDLSGDNILLQRAEELGKIILPVFDTSSGVPLSRINPKRPTPQYKGHGIQLAEAGTLLLEFTRLSQLTGNQTYFNLAHRASSYLNDELAPNSPFKPLLPNVFQTEGSKLSPGVGQYSLGGMADSYYEYLIKQHLLTHGAFPMYSDAYEDFVDTSSTHLFRKVEVVPGRDLLTIGDIMNGRYRSSMEHLSCFTGAILAMGARLLNRPRDLDTGKKLSDTCYFLGAIMPTGQQPERVDFWDAGDPNGVEHVIDADTDEEVDIQKGAPVPGIRSAHPHYLSRPESLETLLYLYRTTGDRRYQAQGWRMFTDWIANARTPHGFSSLVDVRRKPATLGNNMESFVLAETFKYHYLLQTHHSEISLDTYVFNTEAHPFIHDPSMEPGDSQLWDPLRLQPDDKVGTVGEGTDTQKWGVYKEVEKMESASKED